MIIFDDNLTSRLDECGVAAGAFASPLERVRALDASFRDAYGSAPTALYSAPGRTELGGNHTDHQRGRVLTAAVTLDALAVAAVNNDGFIRVLSPRHAPNIVNITSLDAVPAERDSSTALVRGIAAYFKEHGYVIGGANICVQNEIPTGSGLSSSAAFELVIASVLNGLFNGGEVPPVDLAKAGQFAENVYFGKPCGLMDQTASAAGGVVAIDFNDTANPALRCVSLDLAAAGYALCITMTGGSHADLTADYAAIPGEMRAVAAAMGHEILRDCDEAAFFGDLNRLRGVAGDRAVLRAMHFFSENRRALEMSEALDRADLDGYLRLVRASGESSMALLQNIFGAHNPSEQGISLALALSARILSGAGAYRVHGGGFAGTIQAYVPAELVSEYRRVMDETFGSNACRVIQIRKAGAIQI